MAGAPRSRNVTSPSIVSPSILGPASDAPTSVIPAQAGTHASFGLHAVADRACAHRPRPCAAELNQPPEAIDGRSAPAVEWAATGVGPGLRRDDVEKGRKARLAAMRMKDAGGGPFIHISIALRNRHGDQSIQLTHSRRKLSRPTKPSHYQPGEGPNHAGHPNRQWHKRHVATSKSLSSALLCLRVADPWAMPSLHGKAD
jgi:hypothetical protein